MAKIETIKLFPVPKKSTKNQNTQEITIKTKLNFNRVDIQIEMEYHLHVLLLKIDSFTEDPLLYPNWDDGNVVIDTKEFGESFLGLYIFPVKALENITMVEETISISMHGNFLSKGLKAFGSLVPTLAQVTKWSNTYLFHLVLE